MKVKFSIITVTYNSSETLECTIQSVLGQSYADVEYIVIDGASTDGTQEIVRKYEDRIAYWVSEPDTGIYDAMNKGLKKATGDYVCFLNAGDKFHTESTLTQIAAQIADSRPDVIYGQTNLVDESGAFVRSRRLQAPKTLNWKSFRRGMLVCHQSFYAKRELCPEYDTAYRYSADVDWCIRVMKQAKVLHNTNLVLTDYLQEGMTTRNRKASLKERFRIMARHYGWLPTVVMHAWFVVRGLIKK